MKMQTVSKIAREFKTSRPLVLRLMEENDVSFQQVGPCKVIAGADLTRLQSALSRYAKGREAMAPAKNGH